MKIPHNALVALANGEKFVVMRNIGQPLEPRLERIGDLDLELTNFTAGARHQDPAGQRNGSTDINELAHGAAIADWLNGQALQGELGDVVIAVGAVWTAWIMPSLAPKMTRLRRLACAVW